MTTALVNLAIVLMPIWLMGLAIFLERFFK